MEFDSAIRSHVGRRRKINEDAVLGRPDLGLWAVADGMGGHEAGEVASAMVVEGLGACPAGLSLDDRTTAARDALGEVNARLAIMGEEGPRRRTIGSTVVVLLADSTAFACLWAGDSRAYLARDGAITQITRDHSLVQELVDAGEIDPADAASHPNANIITRAVGAGALNLDCATGGVRPGDAFLLASDGLTRLAGDGELLAALQASDLATAADGLIELCLDRGAPDNVSLVLLRARRG